MYDYIYYFDSRGFDYNNNNDWNNINEYTNEKCSISIPGLDHKLCVTSTDDNNYNIRFESSSTQDIDNSYYDLYGYDEYYYNMNNDDDDDNDQYDYEYKYDDEDAAEQLIQDRKLSNGYSDAYIDENDILFDSDEEGK